MGRPAAIEWPDKAKICVTFIVPWEVWPENFGTHESLQRRGGATIPPPKALFKQNMALVTEREYGDRVGIWRISDLFDRHNLKVTFLMRRLEGGAVRATRAKNSKPRRMNFRRKATSTNTRSCTPRSRSASRYRKRWRRLKKFWGKNRRGICHPGTLRRRTRWNWWLRPALSGGRTRSTATIPTSSRLAATKSSSFLTIVPGCNDYSTYGTGRTPRDLLQIMKDQFDYLYWEGEQGAPKYFAFNLHPFVSGVPFRTKIIDEFIQYAKGFPKVWFARRIEIAEWWLQKATRENSRRSRLWGSGNVFFTDPPSAAPR